MSAARSQPSEQFTPNESADDKALLAVRTACELIDKSETAPDLTTLARATGYSASHFQRLFKARLGLSPKQYAMAKRRSRLQDALTNSPSVTNAIYAAGYGASSRAYDAQPAFGMSFETYRKGANGEVIRYAMSVSSLGPILVAATPRGICMIEFGEADSLIETLAQRFPKAQIEPSGDKLNDLVAAVVALIDAPTSESDIPLDIRGTAFQELVWQALTKIPPGTTVSYSELAEKIGRPTAARAVARACASNVLAVAVPCHRVVRGSGEISGYKWGVERKRTLLERERAERERDADQ